MKALKGNKSYYVDEKTKAAYNRAGFDIYDDEGKLIDAAKGKTVPYESFEKLLEENAALKEVKGKLEAEIEALKKTNAAKK